MPSGVWPTVSVSTTRGGLALRSMTLIGVVVAAAAADVGDHRHRAVARCRGRRAAGPAFRSRLVYSTLVPSMESTEMRSSPSRVTSAVLPSGVMATWLTPDSASAMVTLPSGRHRLALDGEHRHRALGAVGDERERALAVDRDARPAPAPASSVAMTAGRRGLEVDDRHAVVRHLLGRIGGIDLHRRGDEGEALVGRDGDAERRPHHARGHGDLGDHPRRRSA